MRWAVQVSLAVVCTASFLQPPRAQLGYNAEGQTVNQTLQLPLSVGKFITPPGAAVPREAFFARWRAIAGAHHLRAAVAHVCALQYGRSLHAGQSGVV